MADRLAAWGLAAWHTAAFLALFVALLHMLGGAGPVFAGLGTAAGSALYAALLACTWWATANALDGVDLGGPWPPLRLAQAAERAVKWGALDGAAFVFLVGIGGAVVARTPAALALLLVGVPAGMVLGMLAGLLLAALDGAAVWAAARVGREGLSPAEPLAPP